MRWGFDGRTVAIALAGVLLAVGLGAWAGTAAGAWAGALTALAGLVSGAVLAVAVDRRRRNMALVNRRAEILRRFAPPGPMGDGEGEE